jgi:cytoskeletal protein CcmA (bactofilin family)
MALFGSEKKQKQMAKQKGSIPQQINLVGEGTTFEGTLRADSDVRASGRLIGRLEVNGKAIVAEAGTVEGEIVATNADIAGNVQGEIHIEDQLVLKSTARVDGTIETDRLVVEEGAVFTGECRMGRLAEEAASEEEVDETAETEAAETEATDERPPQPSDATRSTSDIGATPVPSE